MMDKPHAVLLKPRLLAEDFVREAPRRHSLHRATAAGRFLPAVFFALAVIWVLRHGGFDRVTDILRLARP
jgi:hypothetical protein